MDLKATIHITWTTVFCSCSYFQSKPQQVSSYNSILLGWHVNLSILLVWLATVSELGRWHPAAAAATASKDLSGKKKIRIAKKNSPPSNSSAYNTYIWCACFAIANKITFLNIIHLKFALAVKKISLCVHTLEFEYDGILCKDTQNTSSSPLRFEVSVQSSGIFCESLVVSFEIFSAGFGILLFDAFHGFAIGIGSGIAPISHSLEI